MGNYLIDTLNQRYKKNQTYIKKPQISIPVTVLTIDISNDVSLCDFIKLGSTN